MKAHKTFLAGILVVAILIGGCKSPTGSTAPGSFDVIQDRQVKRASRFYVNKETEQRFTGKVLVYYKPGRLALDMTYINGRLHSVWCYKPDGSLDSEISVGSGVLTRRHGDGEIWERRYFQRGVYTKREEYLEGQLVKTEDINWGDPIANDGMEAFLEKCEEAKHAVFNKKNANLLGGLLLTAGVIFAASQIEVDPGYESSPPHGYYDH